MFRKTNFVICALFGWVLGFGASVSVNDASGPASGRASGPVVELGLVISQAQAGVRDRARRRARRLARRKARAAALEKDREDRENRLIGTSRAELPVDCAYDALASATAGSEIYSCGGMHYQRHQENGIVSYKGNEAGLDPEQVKQARARRALAQKTAREEVRKRREANRISELAPDCYYDGQASALNGAELHYCGGVYYREYSEPGVTGYEVFKP